jgi:agmatinase
MKELKNLQFLGSELQEHENLRASAKFQIVPCPMEKTVSYGSGTCLGPNAILQASQELERSPICEPGVFTQAPIDCSVDHKTCLLELQKRNERIVTEGHFPVILGGEHSLTWAAVNGVSEAIGQKIGIVQVDAHADLRDSYQGRVHSHASVMNLLVQDGHRLASIGVRAICEEEKKTREKYSVFFQDAGELVRANVSSIDLPSDFPELVYLSFDLDGLDPSVIPAVGTPVPGGLGYYQSIDLVKSALKGRTCVGMDLVELSPNQADIVSPFTAASLLQELLAFV